MSAPYSDDLYSGDLSDDDQDALSPVDGYFHASSSSSEPSHPPPTSSNVPSVPNVLVEDPTLSDQGAAKAREAEEERLNNTDNPLPPHAQPQPHPHFDSQSQSSLSQAPAPTQTQPQSPSHFTSPPTSPTHFHRRSVEEDEPIRFAGHTRLAASLPFARDAPPAYSPSLSSPQSANPGAGYQTFGPAPQPSDPQPAAAAAMGVPEEQQRLLPREPESMGGPPDGKPPSMWQRFKSSWSMPELRKKLRSLLGVLVIVSIFLMLFSSFTLRPSKSHKDPEIADPDPVKEPEMDHGDLVWKPLGSCLDKEHQFAKLKYNVDFRWDHNLTVIQTVDRDDREPRTGWNPNVFGEIVLRSTTGSSPGQIDLEIITNDQSLGVEVDYDKETQTYKMITPRHVDWPHQTGSPCIQMRATVWVPREAMVGKLNVQSIMLDLVVKEGLLMGAAEGTRLSSITGDIITPQQKEDDKEVFPYTLASRQIVVDTLSGRVKGWFPLYDLLKIHTASGDVTVDVAPKAVDNHKPESAELDVSSISGRLEAHEPISAAIKAAKPDKKFPPRDYTVNFETSSGDITAEVAFSTKANFESRSGDLEVKLWPVLDSALLKSSSKTKPRLTTSTASGDMTFDILDPLWTSMMTVGGNGPMDPPEPPEPPRTPYAPVTGDPEWLPIGTDDPYVIIHPEDSKHPSELPRREQKDDKAANDMGTLDTPALSVFTSKHDTISGDIKLIYPATWEGSLYAQTISGSQKIRGEGLRVTRSGGSFGHTTTGRKGSGSSEMKVNSVSGDQDLLIGKENK